MTTPDDRDITRFDAAAEHAALLAELRQLAEAATPGPWQACKDTAGKGCVCGSVWSLPADSPVASTDTDSPVEGITSTLDRKQRDAAYIAAANPAAVLALLAELRQAQAERERLAAEVTHLQQAQKAMEAIKWVMVKWQEPERGWWCCGEVIPRDIELTREMAMAHVEQCPQHPLAAVLDRASRAEAALAELQAERERLAAELERLRGELRVSGAWRLREYLDAATQREVNLHERLEVVVTAANALQAQVDRLALVLARLRNSLKRVPYADVSMDLRDEVDAALAAAAPRAGAGDGREAGA